MFAQSGLPGETGIIVRLLAWGMWSLCFNNQTGLSPAERHDTSVEAIKVQLLALLAGADNLIF